MAEPEQNDLFQKDIQQELWRLRVQEAARKQFELERSDQVEIPRPVLVGDPLPDEPPEIIDGVLLSRGATGVIAERDTGKTLISLEIQHSLLTGEPLWGKLAPHKVVPRTVHFLAEHTSATLMRQYAKLRLPKNNNLAIYGPDRLGSSKILISNGVRREPIVSAYKKMAEGAGLVVFDPLTAFIRGENVENDNNLMRSLIDTMIEIADSTGAACLVLGHCGKPSYGAHGYKVSKTEYGARGASSIEDSLTALHYLEHQSDFIFKLKQAKFKGEKHAPLTLIRDRNTLRHVLHG